MHFVFNLVCACLINTNSNTKLDLKQQSLMFHGLISKIAYYLEGVFGICLVTFVSQSIA